MPALMARPLFQNASEEVLCEGVCLRVFYCLYQPTAVPIKQKTLPARLPCGQRVCSASLRDRSTGRLADCRWRCR